MAAQNYFNIDGYSPQVLLLEIGWAPARLFLNLIMMDYAYALLTKGQPLKAWPWHWAPRALAIELTFAAQMAKRFMLAMLPIAALAAFLGGIDKLAWAKPIFWLAGLAGAVGLAIFVLRRLCAPLVLLYQNLEARACLEESRRLSQGQWVKVLLPLGFMALTFASLEELSSELNGLSGVLLAPFAALGMAGTTALAYLRLTQPVKST